MIGIIIKSGAENKEEMAETLRYIASQLDRGFSSGFDPSFQITGEEEPESLKVEDLEPYVGTKMSICGKGYTLSISEEMSGTVAFWQSEIFEITDWTKAKILDMLSTNDAWVEMAIVALFKRQTEVEKQTGETYVKNHVGFQVADAREFGNYARVILAGGHLTADDLRNCRRPWKRGTVAVPTIAKYRGQLLEMIEAKAKAKMLNPA